MIALRRDRFIVYIPTCNQANYSHVETIKYLINKDFFYLKF